MKIESLCRPCLRKKISYHRLYILAPKVFLVFFTGSKVFCLFKRYFWFLVQASTHTMAKQHSQMVYNIKFVTLPLIIPIAIFICLVFHDANLFCINLFMYDSCLVRFNNNNSNSIINYDNKNCHRKCHVKLQTVFGIGGWIILFYREKKQRYRL